jgi:hypothetical protein
MDRASRRRGASPDCYRLPSASMGATVFSGFDQKRHGTAAGLTPVAVPPVVRSPPLLVSSGSSRSGKCRPEGPCIRVGWRGVGKSVLLAPSGAAAGPTATSRREERFAVRGALVGAAGHVHAARRRRRRSRSPRL